MSAVRELRFLPRCWVSLNRVLNTWTVLWDSRSCLKPVENTEFQTARFNQLPLDCGFSGTSASKALLCHAVQICFECVPARGWFPTWSLVIIYFSVLQCYLAASKCCSGVAPGIAIQVHGITFLSPGGWPFSCYLLLCWAPFFFSSTSKTDFSFFLFCYILPKTNAKQCMFALSVILWSSCCPVPGVPVFCIHLRGREEKRGGERESERIFVCVVPQLPQWPKLGPKLRVGNSVPVSHGGGRN